MDYCARTFDVHILQTMDSDKYPYPTDANDHCETPLVAYEHITGLLKVLASSLGKKATELLVYDPYFCEGAMVDKMNGLGFSNVYNKKEDFYKRIENNTIPKYDVLITNPPYSEDHIPKLLNFVSSSNKPSLLLLPNFVSTKPYFNSAKFTFLCPKKRYMYETPKGRRQKKSSTYTSPFASFWYCFKIEPFWNRDLKLDLKGSCVYSNMLAKLPLNMLPDNHPVKRRQKNALKRKKNKDRKKKKLSGVL